MRAPRATQENPVKRWVFTLNNYTPEEKKDIENALTTYASYAVIGIETGANGTPHLQGFAIMRLRERMSGMKRVLKTNRIHLEKARGTSHQAAIYCKKDGVFWETGTPPSAPGIRNSTQEQLEAAKKAVDMGATVEDLWELHFGVMCKYQRAMETYIQIKKKQEERKKPWVEIIYGQAGTGKTRYCHQMARIFYDSDVWIYPGRGWFDGYTGQKVVIFDDFYGDMDFGVLLKVLDRYKLTVPVKGGFTTWNPERIYITSNVHWAEWYPKILQYQRNALERRFSVVHEVFFDIFE